MKIILSGGGTGGHVTPAIALIEYIRDMRLNVEFLFIGRKDGEENQPVREIGISVKELNVIGLKRQFTPKNILSGILAIASFFKAKRIIKKYMPDFVIGTGGYVCWPVLAAAYEIGIPCYIHESNAYPGLVTRMVGKRCKAVFTNFEETAKHLNNCNVINVGNPIRKGIKSISKADAKKSLGIGKNELLVLSFGGSGGAEALNDCIGEIFKTGYNYKTKIIHIHATGRKYYDKYKKLNGKTLRTVPYINNMALHLAAADLVICRCGAMTLSEIATAAVPAILIPSPNVTDNHQLKNALAVKQGGGAIVIEENDLRPSTLKSNIIELMRNIEKRKKMSKCLEKFAKQGAEEKIIETVFYK